MFRSGEFTGHRIWRVVDKHRLFSIYAPKEWVGGLMTSPHAPVSQAEINEAHDKDADEAKHGFRPKNARQLLERKGVYSFKECIDALEYASWTSPHYGPLLIGEIAMWGIVWEHGIGYRAQSARILSVESFKPSLPWVYPDGVKPCSDDEMEQIRALHIPSNNW